MPLVQVTLMRGRTQVQLDRLSQRISDALQEECNALEDTIQIIYTETERASWHNAEYLRSRKPKGR